MAPASKSLPRNGQAHDLRHGTLNRVDMANSQAHKAFNSVCGMQALPIPRKINGLLAAACQCCPRRIAGTIGKLFLA